MKKLFKIFILFIVVFVFARTESAPRAQAAFNHTSIVGYEVSNPVALQGPLSGAYRLVLPTGNMDYPNGPGGNGHNYFLCDAGDLYKDDGTHNNLIGTPLASGLSSLIIYDVLTAQDNSGSFLSSLHGTYGTGDYAIKCGHGASSTLIGGDDLIMMFTITGTSPYFSSYAPASTVNNVTLTAPTDGSITGSTTVTLSGSYLSDPFITFSAGTFVGVNVHLIRNDGAFSVYAPIDQLVPVVASATVQSWTTNIVLPTGSNWTAVAQLQYGTTLLYSSLTTSFSVVTYPTGPISGIPPPDVSGTCATYGFPMDDLCKAAEYLVRPDSDSVSQFKTLTLSHSAPFSYLYDVPVLFQELFANTGSMAYSVSVNTGALGTISFISASQISAVPYSATIKLLLGYLLYFFTGMTLYRMLLKTHD
jgi:hypothetical protein